MNYNTTISHVNNHFNDFTPTNGIGGSLSRHPGIGPETATASTARAQLAGAARSEPALDRADRRAQQGDVLEHPKR